MTLETWKIEAVATTGEMPGWIHNHDVSYEPERDTLCISGGELAVIAKDGESTLEPNEQKYELDLTSLRWRRLK